MLTKVVVAVRKARIRLYTHTALAYKAVHLLSAGEGTGMEDERERGSLLSMLQVAVEVCERCAPCRLLLASLAPP